LHSSNPQGKVRIPSIATERNASQSTCNAAEINSLQEHMKAMRAKAGPGQKSIDEKIKCGSGL